MIDKNIHMLSALPNFCSNEVHSKNNQNAIVMYSGGLDSTVALWWAIEHYKNVKVVIVDYNQPHHIEIEYAQSIVKMTGMPSRVIKVDLPHEYWGIENKLTRGQACFMTSLAALDISHDGADIIHGILKSDTYGDCNRDFLDSLAEVLFHIDDRGKIGIATPLRALDTKTSVIALGYQLGAPVNQTWTCRSPEQNKPCHQCIQCKLREEAFGEFFKEYGLRAEVFDKWQDVLGSPYHPMFQNTSKLIDKLASTFIELGGLKYGVPGWRYQAPDGTERMATNIRTVENYPLDVWKKGKLCNNVSVHGFFEDNYRWEVSICDDGRVAITDRIPEFSVVEKALLARISL